MLERSSARETASRVALGAVAALFLEQSLGIRTVAHVISIGGAGVEDPASAPLPAPDDVAALDASPVRTLDKAAEARMIARIDEAKANADTLGGVVEVIAYGVPAGIGTYVESDRRLDAALASALMGIQAIKGVEIGDGFLEALRPGSQAHDEIMVGDDGRITRMTNRAGGIEGGMSNGQPIRVRAAMKPIPSIPKALRTVDVLTGEAAQAINQRSDSTRRAGGRGGRRSHGAADHRAVCAGEVRRRQHRRNPTQRRGVPGLVAGAYALSPVVWCPAMRGSHHDDDGCEIIRYLGRIGGGN